MPIEKSIQLCIPKMSNKITRQYIHQTFLKMNIGEIYRMIENPLRADPNYKRVILFIKWDNTKELAKEIQGILQDPTEHMNIVYDMPWYWQIYANHPQK
jgi:lauroyl/myristoyl acyltransferase